MMSKNKKQSQNSETESPQIEPQEAVETSSEATETEEAVLLEPEDIHQQPTANKTSNKGVAVAILFALAAAGFSGWSYYQQQQALEAQQVVANKYQQSLDNAEQTIADFASQLQARNTQITTLNQQQQAIQQQQTQTLQQLAIAQDRIRLLTNQGKNEWLLEQAEYYLTLAQQKLLFEQDVQTSLALLEEADASINKMSDLRLNTIRESIANDRAHLLTLPKADTAGLINQLEALRSQLYNLEPDTLKLPDLAEQKRPEGKEWFDKLMETLGNLGDDWIRPHYHDQKVPNFLPQEHKGILVATLQLALLQTQAAVMNHDQKLFDSRIVVMQQLLKDFYRLNESAQAISDEITALSQQSVENTQEPIYLSSLNQLKQEKEARRLEWLNANSGVDTEEL
ncbi:uroporphyrinogen-III C-methyltransferase [Pleionea sp. CnH1-48]|uniref:uroporphyrinogen-III C-methyltransferase n=1 Tax=Pleionea sp. CnH1-48 TaxID=2954494 RepID=UPI00209736CA|nr:uroporphyrinogen-III C-methyltransferase [Pleionea sp. CnH1-48]MCO7227093.1 uroporphyrinogen-III C-methyltransferase [Pleionea sp. CnH1-48]